MLLLLLRLGADRYALDARQVVEVMPVVKLKRIPPAPAYVAGMFNYRGKPVPVIDLCQVVENRPARHLLSSRIIVVNYPMAGAGQFRVGLLAEGATEVMKGDEAQLMAPGFKTPGCPCLGRIIPDANGLIQEIEVEPLLPDTVKDLLFHTQETADAPHG